MLGKAQRDAELAFEKDQLTKAETDLEQGRVRYRDQQELLAQMATRGRDTVQAERLLQLFGQTLSQWECHRDLILHRIAHLEALNRLAN
jgi:hypothetical protein